MVVYKDNTAASNAMHAIRSGSVSAAIDAGITVEWVQAESAPDAAASAAGSATPSTTTAATPSEQGNGRGHESEHANGDASSQPHSAAPPGAQAASDSSAEEAGGGRSSAGAASMPRFLSWQPGVDAGADSILNHRDYESVTLMRSLPPPPRPSYALPPSCAQSWASVYAHSNESR
jgi:hypothetical protein